MARRGDVCCWCGVPPTRGKSTKEHVVPQWAWPFLSAAIRALHRFPKAVACFTCNREKGPMPPALFALVRQNRPARKRAQRQWGNFAAIAADCLREGTALPADVRVHIDGWMSRTVEMDHHGVFITRPEAWDT